MMSMGFMDVVRDVMQSWRMEGSYREQRARQAIERANEAERRAMASMDMELEFERLGVSRDQLD